MYVVRTKNVSVEISYGKWWKETTPEKWRREQKLVLQLCCIMHHNAYRLANHKPQTTRRLTENLIHNTLRPVPNR